MTASARPNKTRPNLTMEEHRWHQADATRAYRHTGQVGPKWQLPRKRHQRLHQEYLAGAAS